MSRPRIVGVRLDRNGPVRFFDAGELDVQVGDTVFVPGPDGPQPARVVVAPDQILSHPFADPLPRLESRPGEG
jgi:hypothetical protein